MNSQAARIRTIIAGGYPGWLSKPPSASTSDRLNTVQIRISTGGASAPKRARNADTQGRLSSKAKYIGVAQQPAIIRRVFEAAVSRIAGKAIRAPRAGNAIPPEHHELRAAVDAGRPRQIGGCGETLGRRLAVVAVASIDHNGLSPGTNLDRATLAMRHVCGISRRHRLHSKDKLGNTPLHIAALHDQFAIAALLIANGADVKTQILL